MGGKTAAAESLRHTQRAGDIRASAFTYMSSAA
jgi:hypothetical protein